MSLTQIEFQAEGTGDAPAQAIQGRSPWMLAWRRLRQDKVAIASGALILVLALLAILAPVISSLVGHSPDTPYTNTGLNSQGLPVGPSGTFLFGTDGLGRDLFVRVLYGAQISLLVGFVSTLIGTAAGVVMGMTAGYFGGVIDTVLARFIDSVLAFPYVVLALALAVVFGPSLSVTIGVISFFSWAAIARVVRGQTLSIKEKEYVEAARSIGSGPWRIMFIDILPNLIAPVLVLATLAVPTAIVFEATLSYLGVGIQPPTSSWGNLLSQAQTFYQTSWWYLVFPAGFLLLTTLAFNLLGDGVRDAMDPRTERLFASQRKGRRSAAKRARPTPPATEVS
ncbi:MAG TPA: ABC transporter permease [Streptosporangiaceae bacterium]|jgi:peptide/nickel transport system permease protein|nr:ABC transporter permease [Streptosporangiaceae bacterium]